MERFAIEMTTTQRTRRQHYVPSCYLSQFATPKERTGRLMVFDRQSGLVRPSTPGNEAHVRDFYAVELDDLSDVNVAENALAKLEGIFAPAIARVNETSGLPANLRPLLAFIAMQFVRTPSARAWFREGYNAIWMTMLEVQARDRETFRRVAKNTMPDASEAEVDEMYDSIREFLRQPGARVVMDQTRLIGDAFELAGELEDVLAERCWLLGLTPDDSFAITSDDPVVLEWNGDGDPTDDWHPAFADPKTVVLIALGPRHMLAGVPDERRGKRRFRLTREQVAQFNTRVALRASRFVYFAGTSFPFLQDGVLNEGPSDWLKGDETDARGGRKRGIVKVITE